MTKRPTAQAIDVLGNVGTPRQDGRQPALCMSWTVDPATGKPVACWVVEGAALTREIALRAAA